jgi:hypothetical protein
MKIKLFDFTALETLSELPGTENENWLQQYSADILERSSYFLILKMQLVHNKYIVHLIICISECNEKYGWFKAIITKTFLICVFGVTKKKKKNQCFPIILPPCKNQLGC